MSFQDNEKVHQGLPPPYPVLQQVEKERKLIINKYGPFLRSEAPFAWTIPNPKSLLMTRPEISYHSITSIPFIAFVSDGVFNPSNDTIGTLVLRLSENVF